MTCTLFIVRSQEQAQMLPEDLAALTAPMTRYISNGTLYSVQSENFPLFMWEWDSLVTDMPKLKPGYRFVLIGCADRYSTFNGYEGDVQQFDTVEAWRAARPSP